MLSAMFAEMFPVRPYPLDQTTWVRAISAAAVDPLERLLVQEQREVVPARHLAHHFHDDLVVIGGDVRFFEDGRALELARRHLVMSGLCGYAELIELFFNIVHERQYPLFDAAEVLVFQLLPAESELGMSLTSAYQLVPEQSTAAIILHHPEAKYFNIGESRISQLIK